MYYVFYQNISMITKYNISNIIKEKIIISHFIRSPRYDNYSLIYIIINYYYKRRCSETIDVRRVCVRLKSYIIFKDHFSSSLFCVTTMCFLIRREQLAVSFLFVVRVYITPSTVSPRRVQYPSDERVGSKTAIIIIIHR